MTPAMWRQYTQQEQSQDGNEETGVHNMNCTLIAVQGFFGAPRLN